MTDIPEFPAKPVAAIHPGLQFLILAGVLIALILIGNLAGGALITALYGLKTLLAFTTLDTGAPHFVSALWILQTLGTTLPILVTPIFFAYVIVHDVPEYIKPTFRVPLILFLLVLVIMICSNPLIEVLSNINQRMVLPPWLKWMRDSEDNAQKLTGVLLDMKTPRGLIFNLLFVGLVTAIVEEFLFRGVLQTIFIRWTGSVNAAVWITAILFSAFHVEFFGFLPRLLLGVFFGYFVAWSGSIWTGVWAHFINNGTAVLVTYLFQHKQINMNPDNQHVFNPLAYILSLGIVVLLMYGYHRASRQRAPVFL